MADAPVPPLPANVDRYHPAPHARADVVDLRSALTQGTPTSGQRTLASTHVAAEVLAARHQAGDQAHLVSLLHPHSFAAEQYRALRHLLEQEHRAATLSIVAVSSPSTGDGKTTTAINLAGALAQTPDVRVLLVDADLRRPTLATRLGMKGIEGPADPGLLEAIYDDSLTLDHIVRRHPEFNLSILSPGRGKDFPYEALKAPRLGKLLDEARRQYDYVLVDTPPLVPLADCRLIAKWVDKFIVVVAAHKTRRRLLEESLRILPADRLLGLVFNCDDWAVPRYYYDSSAYGSSNGFDDGHLVPRWRQQVEVVRAVLRRQTDRKAGYRQH